MIRFYENLRQRLAGIPGVRGATISDFPLVSGAMSVGSVDIPGVDVGRNADTSNLGVGPRFFSTMQIPVLLGREIEERDVSGEAKVAVVNEVFARTHFGGESPIGRRIRLGPKSPEREI